MEKRERKPGYFARLKRRRELKQSQSVKIVTEQNSSLETPIISCPDVPASCPNQTSSEANSQRVKPSPPEASDDICNTKSQTKKKKSIPPGTVEYTVGPQDTLNSIALKFNITPNKLVQINRLFSRSIYPGQKLFVPVGQSEDDFQTQGPRHPATPDGQSEKQSHVGDSGSRLNRPICRELSPPSEDESPATVKFIKMSCKYFTDGMGVVGGVMIVTPNNIMFDPHKSDPLVIEHGCEEYGLICPMEEVVSVALYDDVSRMRLKDELPSDLSQDLCPLYRPGEWEELPSERDLNPFSRYEALDPKRPIVLLDDIEPALSSTLLEAAEHERTEKSCSEREGTEKSSSDGGFTELDLPVNGSTEDLQTGTGLDLQTGTGLDLQTGTQLHNASAGQDHQGALPGSPPAQTDGQMDTLQADRPLGRREEEEDEGLVQSGSTNGTADSQVSSETDENQVHAGMLEGKPTDISLAAAEAKDMGTMATTETGALVNGISHGVADSVHPIVDQSGKLTLNGTARASGKCSPQGEIPAKELDVSTGDECVSEEEKRKRSAEAEAKSWLLERIHAPIEDMLLCSEEKSKSPPMFLCFKVGKPMRKSFAIGQTSSPAHSYGGQGKQPEYWFAVPQERVDHLYAFFVQWSPDVYGKEAREQGFVVVDKDELHMIDNFFSDPGPRSWEIITINEAKRRQSFGSFDGEESGDPLPVLTEPSALLQDTHIEKLACRLPARVQGYPWRLAYSTGEHGTSLKTLYRSLAQVDSPVLLVVKDMDSQVFGAFSTHPFRVSEHCYGTGETFLYSFCPEIKVFRWTGDNSYFVKGNIDSLQLGGGGGQLGLWLDADLYHGSTSTCATFNNLPLSSQKDFIVHSLEVWAFE